MENRRQTLGAFEPDAGTNAGLWLDAFLSDFDEKGPGKQKHLERLGRIAVAVEYRRFFERWQTSLKAITPYTRMEKATVLGRMVVGLGAESVLETAIALHRTYGVPYIPGSALKGLAAAAAHKHLDHPDWRKIGEDGKTGPSHRLLFGDQESSGYVIFHDALWIPNGDQLPLDLDVMTVHHPDYYQGKENAPPADWDSPRPIAFVTAHGDYLLAVTGPEKWIDAALQILREALETDGIGAKTAAGYGRMSLPAKSAPAAAEKANWEPRLQSLNFGNAGDIVPRLLQELNGEEQQRAAAAIVTRLGRRDLRKRQDKDWVKQVLQLAGE